MNNEAYIAIHLHAAHTDKPSAFVDIRLNRATFWCGTQRDFLLMLCATTPKQNVCGFSVVSQLLSVFNENKPPLFSAFGEAGEFSPQTLVMKSVLLRGRKSFVEISYLCDGELVFERTFTECEYKALLRSRKPFGNRACEHLSRFLLLLWTDTRTSDSQVGLIAAFNSPKLARAR